MKSNNTDLHTVTRCMNLFKGLEIPVKEINDELYENQAGKIIQVDKWINLVPLNITKQSITNQDVIWDVEVETVIHGCHYHKDGSGEPDDTDIISIVTGISLQKAIETAWNLIIKNNLKTVQEELFYEDLKEIEEICEKDLTCQS